LDRHDLSYKLMPMHGGGRSTDLRFFKADCETAQAAENAIQNGNPEADKILRAQLAP
jgi:hypothetical protein